MSVTDDLSKYLFIQQTYLSLPNKPGPGEW
jgi:hypothetical protein